MTGGRQETSRNAQTEVDGQYRVRSDMKGHQLDPKVTQNREARRNAIIAIDPGEA